MTPSIYSNLAARIIRYKKYLWLSTVVCMLILLASVAFSNHFSSAIPQHIHFYTFMPLCAFLWWLLMPTYWFGPSSNLNPANTSTLNGVTRLTNTLQSWLASLFLTIWLLSIIIVFPLVANA